MVHAFSCKNKCNSEWHILMEFEHNNILLQGNGSVIIKKKYLCQIKFDSTFVNLNIKGLQLILNIFCSYHLILLNFTQK